MPLAKSNYILQFLLWEQKICHAFTYSLSTKSWFQKSQALKFRVGPQEWSVVQSRSQTGKNCRGWHFSAHESDDLRKTLRCLRNHSDAERVSALCLFQNKPSTPVPHCFQDRKSPLGVLSGGPENLPCKEGRDFLFSWMVPWLFSDCWKCEQTGSPSIQRDAEKVQK